MASSYLYSYDFLLGELWKHAVYSSRNEYIYFQADSLRNIKPEFDFDFLITNIIHLSQKGLLDGELITEVAYTSPSSRDSYQKNLTLDDATPLSLAVPGQALFVEAIRSIDEWIDRPIYRNHCLPYDYYWILFVSYRFPHHKTTFMIFDYIKPKGPNFSSNITEEQVEYLSFPYFLGWLKQYGAICSDTLHEWLELLVSITPAQFDVLRALVGGHFAGIPDLACQLSRSKRTLEKHVEILFDGLRDRQDILKSEGKNFNRILELVKAYYFLDVAPGSTKRMLPRRCRL